MGIVIAGDDVDGNFGLGEFLAEGLDGKSSPDALLFTVGQIACEHEEVHLLLETEIFKSCESRKGCFLQLLSQAFTIGQALGDTKKRGIKMKVRGMDIANDLHQTISVKIPARRPGSKRRLLVYQEKGKEYAGDLLALGLLDSRGSRASSCLSHVDFRIGRIKKRYR